MKKNVNTRQVLRILFFVYSLFLLWLLFFRSPSHNVELSYRQHLELNTNLKPLLTIRNYLYVIVHRSNPALIRHCVINLAGNVLLFIPMGCMMPALFRKQRNLLLFLLTCTALILSVELAQLFSLLGSFDVDDIILNLGGLLIGYGLFWIVHLIRRK